VLKILGLLIVGNSIAQNYLNRESEILKKEINMEKLHFSTVISVPKEKVWNTMLNQDSYQKWTDVFAKGSYYVGDWSKGSKILFLAPKEAGGADGMVSRIKESRPFEHVSIEHLGFVHDGKEDTTSDEVKKWAGALENYTFKQTNGKTEVSIDMEITEEYKEMFQNTWPKALQKLKELAEK
jgi:L-rhamnose mutarotase